MTKEVSSMKEKDIQRETSQIVKDVLEKANLKQGSIFVLGLSSSEVIGGQIGKESSQEIGEIIVKTILDILEEKGIHLAVQGCEHVNRALVVERQVAERFWLEIVSVLPTLHAGGSGQLAAFKFMQDPVDWISEILQLACMSSMFRFQFALFWERLGMPM